MSESQSEITTVLDPIWTISAVLKSAVEFLKKNYSDTPEHLELQNFKIDAELILAQAIGCKRLDLFLNLDKPLKKHEREQFKVLLGRRVRGEPVAHILGSKEFFGLKFKVTSETLIPRPDTETAVECILNLAAKKTGTLNILDVGTGSGCIAISLAKNLSRAEVLGCDISGQALDVANINKVALKTDNAQFLLADCLDLNFYCETLRENKFDFIVSNPPYISELEKNGLPISVKKFEPALALFPRGIDALLFYRIFAQQFKKLLRSEGFLVLEVGSTQALEVVEILTTENWVQIRVHKDLAGIDRVVTAQITTESK